MTTCALNVVLGRGWEVGGVKCLSDAEDIDGSASAACVVLVNKRVTGPMKARCEAAGDGEMMMMKGFGRAV